MIQSIGLFWRHDQICRGAGSQTTIDFREDPKSIEATVKAAPPSVTSSFRCWCAIVVFLCSCGERLLAQQQSLILESNRQDPSGRLEDSIAKLRKLEKTEGETHGQDSKERQAALESLMRALGESGAYEQACITASELHRVTNQRNGDRHWTTIDARNSHRLYDQLLRLSTDERLEFKLLKQTQAEAEKLDIDGSYSEAATKWEEAAAGFRKLFGDENPYAFNALIECGGSHSLLGNYQRAEKMLSETRSIAERWVGPDHPSYGLALNSLAGVYHRRGDLARVEPLLVESLSIVEASFGKRHSSYATAVNNLAFVYLKMGDYDSAHPLFEDSLNLRADLYGREDPRYATGLNNLGLVYLNRGDYQAAQPLFDEALSITQSVYGTQHPQYAMAQKNVALVAMFLGHHHRADEALKEVLRIRAKRLGKSHLDYAEALIHIAELRLAQGQIADAGKFASQGLGIALDALDRSGDSQTEREQLALLAQLRHYLDLSLSGLTDAKAAYDALLGTKGLILAQQRRRQELLLVRNDETSRLDAANLVRVSSELAALVSGHGETTRRERESLLVRLGRERDEIESRLTDRLGVSAKATDIRRCDLTALQSAIPEHAALIDFAVYWKRSHDASTKCGFRSTLEVDAFVVHTSGNPIRVELGDAKQLFALIHSFRKLIVDDGIPAPGLELRRLVWDPIESALDDVVTVILSLDGEVATLPFNALPSSSPGRFLIEDYNIVSVPAAQLLPLFLTDPNIESTTLLVVGNIDYDAEPSRNDIKNERADRSGMHGLRWRRLPGTVEELRSVQGHASKQLPPVNLQVLEGAQASENNVRKLLPGCRYAHFATHGLFTPKEGVIDENSSPPKLFGRGGVKSYFPSLRTGIVLAGANATPLPSQDDGIMTALEIGSLELGSLELAVLSACDTGLGESAGSEGLLGLERALIVSGCHSVIASKWAVDDGATSVLMDRFYSNLWAKGMGKSESLREAQLWMLNNPEEVLSPRILAIRGVGGARKAARPSSGEKLPPRYWAAFSICGDWR